MRNLSCKISSTEHWKHTCIEELANENDIGYELQFDGFCIASTIGHDQRNNSSNHKIDNNDHILNSVVFYKCCEIVSNVFFTHLATCWNLFCTRLNFPCESFIFDAKQWFSFLLTFNFAESFKESLHWRWIFPLLSSPFYSSKSLEIIGFNICWIKVINFNSWPFVCHLNLQFFERENNNECDGKHENRNAGNCCDSTIVVGTDNVSIFPDNIRWFSCLCVYWFFTHNHSFFEIFMNILSLVVEQGFFAETQSLVFAIIWLKGNESTNWLGDLFVFFRILD